MNMAVEHSSNLLGMWTAKDKAVPLEGIHVEAELALPVAITRQTQTYCNTLNKPIEARYVFPVPLDAVLLGLEIRIGDRVLQGVVKPRNDAERDYEQAVVKGDSAFLLTKLDDGLYQISLGNIMAKERVLLTVTWAETLRWNGQEIRYRLPNLVGEQYGNPQRAGIAPEDAPTHSSTAAYDFDLSILLRGDLAGAAISSPNHRIRQVSSQEGLRINLDTTDWLDRSFTLLMHAANPPSLVAWSAPDGDALAVMASCYPPVPVSNEQAHHVTLLIDGSGSMDGVSIDQARTAAIEIVQTLRDQDTCSLAAFGSQTVLLTPTPLLVGEHRQQLLSHCQRLKAHLGGTEMQTALTQVISITPVGGDILMVTDGQVFFSDTDIRQFTLHQRRLFTIGVGHSTSEKVLRQLSEASGGFCELVSPNEGMASHIVSHFRRLRAPRLMPTYIWPGEVLRKDAPHTVFAGDTAIMSARLTNVGPAELRVNMSQADLKAVIEPAQGLLATFLPRLVASKLLPSDNIKQAREEAVQYQLVTEHTSMIAIMKREQSSEEAELPTVIDVPQMEVHNAPKMAFRMPPAGVCFNSSMFNEPTARFLEEPSYLHQPDTDWLLSLNSQLEHGASLQELLVMESLPQDWQSIIRDMSSKWSLQQLVLGVIAITLDALDIARLRKCRLLAKKVHQACKGDPAMDIIKVDVEGLASRLA